MLTLLSPAKKLDESPYLGAVAATEPRMHTDIKELARTAKTQSADDLKSLMHLSDKLAALNAERFSAFRLSGGSNSAKPAVLSFNGDVYGGLDASSLSGADLKFAQDNLRILSGLYGLLRPMDKIQPYRLEMGTRLKNPRGKNLYEFWGTKIAGAIQKDLTAHDHPAILNLASNEYFKAVDKKSLNARIIEAKFLNVKDGKTRNLMYYAKRARGLMARWVIENRVDAPDALHGFDAEGYRIDQSQSSENALVFTRPQPPTKN